MANIRCRNWIFTIHNVPNDSVDPFVDPNDDGNDLRAIAYQMELCPTTGREHIQGYAEFTRALYKNGVKQQLGYNHAHVEPRKGSRKQAFDYATKERTRKPDCNPVIAGTWPASFTNKGQYQEAYDLLKTGATVLQITEVLPAIGIRHKRSLEEIRRELTKKKVKPYRNVVVHTFWGPARTGKSRRAEWLARKYIADRGLQEEPYRKDVATKWWDGYDGHLVVIVDDLASGCKINFRDMLRMLDGYSQPLEFKGGYTNPHYELVIITSNEHPKEWFHEHPYGPGTPLHRRLEVEHGSGVEYMDGFWTPPEEPVLESMEVLPASPVPDPVEEFEGVNMAQIEMQEMGMIPRPDRPPPLQRQNATFGFRSIVDNNME